MYIDLLTEKGLQMISMDGKGRAIDNIFIERLWQSVKYEQIYMHPYEGGLTLYKWLKQYFIFYNDERWHQSLEYETPLTMYRRAA
ncbi:MAG: integrase core domain-containing protein [Flammeovirgaceae bacterium]